MEPFPLIAATLVVAAAAAWINQRWLRLPTTIGVMVLSLVGSGAVVLFAPPGLRERAREALVEVDFSHALLDVMLAFLLFAGALHVKLDQLYRNKRIVLLLATVGVLASTLGVGALTWGLVRLVGEELPLGTCLVFGAVVAPTDPIAVLAVLKRAGAPKSLETKIAGESLFNDGVAVVVFLVVVGLVAPGAEPLDAAGVGRLFLQEVGGSLVLGAAAGALAFVMMRGLDHYQVEVLITLALCAGLYALADGLHASGPLAVVVAGLLIGNTGRRLAMSPLTAERVDVFWELVDEVLNVVLFLLIGTEVLVLSFGTRAVLAGALAVPAVLLVRFLSVGGAVALLRRGRTFTPHAVKIMTWGGLRGGISVALALSLPAALPGRELVLTMTYVVVVFSIVVQGLTVGRLVALVPRPEERDAPAH